jgi:hypothetical protein
MGQPGSGSILRGPLTAAGTYNGLLNCGGATDTATLIVQADIPRSVDLFVNNVPDTYSTSYNTGVTASWSFSGSDVTGCEGFITTASGTTNVGAVSGNSYPYTVTEPATFIINCNFANGASDSDTVQVNVKGSINITTDGTATYRLTGPNGYVLQDSVSRTVSDIDFGSYTLSVPSLPPGYGYTVTPCATQTLQAGPPCPAP